MSAHKEGVAGVVGELLPQPGKKKQHEQTPSPEKRNFASTALGRKGMVIYR
jgi:hypothetical protein